MKDYKFVELTSEQLFAFCEVLDAIGIDAFANIFSKEQLEEFEDDDNAEKVGMAIGVKILKVLIKELPKAKRQIYTFLASCVEGLNEEEIAKLPLPQFMKLIKEFFINEGMRDFFKEAASLFVKE